MRDLVFISSSRGDVDIARSLSEHLESAGLETWLAADEIRHGERWNDLIRDRLDAARAVVLLVGREPGSWTRWEWAQAVRRSWGEDRDFAVVPVIVEEASAPPVLRDVAHVDWQGDAAHAAEQVVALMKAGTDQPSLRSDRHGPQLAERWSQIADVADNLTATDGRAPR